EQLLPGAALKAGEAIRFEVASQSEGYLYIAGIDSAENVTPYFGDANTVLVPGPGHLLDGSVTLDATMGVERIFALLCKKPIDREAIVAHGKAALGRAGGDPARIAGLESGCTETSFLIAKVPALE